MPESTPPLFAVEDLTVRYATDEGDIQAVTNVHFEVHRGEIVGVVGESGSGKSTLASASINLIQFPGRVTSGSANLRGSGDLLRLRRRKLRELRGLEIGYVAQNPFGSLNPVLRIREQFHNIMRAHVDGVSQADSVQVSREALLGVGIREPERVLNGWVHELSGGMAQRVVIAMASFLNPRLIVADEFTTALDVTVQRQILDMFVDLLAAADRGILLVTHDLGIVAQYCHRVLVMYAGRIVESGPVGVVLGRPAHPYTQALIAAIPHPGRDLVPLKGTPPNLLILPKGCSFSPRCPYAFDKCKDQPSLKQLTMSQYAACHLEGGVTVHVTSGR